MVGRCRYRQNVEDSAPSGDPHPIRLDSCELCGIGQLCLTSSLLGGDLEELKPAVRNHRRLDRGERLFVAGQRQRAVFVVRSGSIKLIDIDRDGREQVIEFCLPGDVLALEDSVVGRHQYHALALEDAWVCTIPVNALNQLVFEKPQLSRQAFAVLCRKVHEQRQLQGRLSAADATCKVAAFLLGLSRRYRRRRLPHRRFRLSMDRADIANHLGLQLETVSRSFTALQQRGLISVHGKALELADEEGLEQEVSDYLPAA